MAVALLALLLLYLRVIRPWQLRLDVGDIIMLRKCMLGIKERAEGLARHTLAAG